MGYRVWHACLSWGYCCSDEHHDQKHPVEERVNFTYTFVSQFTMEESRGRNSEQKEEAGGYAEAMEGLLLTDLCLGFAQSAFL